MGKQLRLRYLGRSAVAVALFFSTSLVIALPAGAMEDMPAADRLVNVPAPEILPHLGGALSVDGRFFTDEPDVADDLLVSWGPNFRLGIGVLNRVEVGVEAVSAFDSLDQFTGYLRVMVLEEGKNWPAVGIGAFDLTTEPAPNVDVGLPATNRGDLYLEDDKTNNSAYIVLAKCVPEIESVPLKLRIYLGIGSGRFLARVGKAEDFSGAFMGGELKYKMLRLVGEMDGRNANAGLGTCMPIYEGKGYKVAVNGMLQGKYLQHAQSGRSDAGLYPAIGARLGVTMVPLED